MKTSIRLKKKLNKLKKQAKQQLKKGSGKAKRKTYATGFEDGLITAQQTFKSLEIYGYPVCPGGSLILQNGNIRIFNASKKDMYIGALVNGSFLIESGKNE